MSAAEFVLCITADRLREFRAIDDALAFVGGAEFVLVMNENKVHPDVAASQLLAHVSKYLELEITEGLLLENNEQSLVTLRELREMGVQVAIDDFGTGYSSLSYLTRFQFDRLKIDRSFFIAMEHDRSSAAIVSAIIAMAHALGIRVTAEGVETEVQMERLRALQCDEVQGYWFSRPLTAKALETALAPLSRPPRGRQSAA